MCKYKDFLRIIRIFLQLSSVLSIKLSFYSMKSSIKVTKGCPKCRMRFCKSYKSLSDIWDEVL